MSVTPQKPRATIFFFDGYLSISASVLSTALELRLHGYDVDVLYNSPPIDVPPPAPNAGIELHEHTPWTRWIVQPVVDALRRNRLNKLSQVVADDALRKRSARLRGFVKGLVALLEIPQFAFFCWRHLRQTDLAIAFDMNSLAAMDLVLPRKTPFIYWSLEIIMMSEVTEPFSRWMKRHELRRLAEANAVVAQSVLRRNLLETDLKAILTNYREVPNAPSTPLPSDLREDFFSDRFSFPPDSWVVLHSGFISTSLLSLEIAETVASWDENFVLIFHERQRRDPEEPYLRAVQTAGGGRVILSLTPVPFDQVDLVYAGADIGIVCYQNADSNESTGWASSGKLVFYLRHGLPIVVVMPECPSIISKWSCGVWASSVDDIGRALATIVADYEGYSARARHAYREEFDFAAAFDRMLAQVGSS